MDVLPRLRTARTWACLTGTPDSWGLVYYEDCDLGLLVHMVRSVYTSDLASNTSMVITRYLVSSNDI